MPQPSTPEVLATLVAEAVEPLTSALGSPAAAQDLLAHLGWEVPPAVTDLGLGAVAGSAQAVVDKLFVLIGSTDAERADAVTMATRIAELALAVATFVQSVVAAATALPSVPGTTAEWLARTQIETELGRRLLDFVLITHARRHSRLLFALLQFAGVFELRPLPADPVNFQTAHTRHTVHWERFATIVSGETSWAEEVYSWGQADADLAALIANIGEVLLALGASVTAGTVSRAVEEALSGRTVPEADTDPMPRLAVHLLRGIGEPLDIGLSLLGLRATSAGGTDAGLAVQPFAFGTAAVAIPFALPDGLAFVLESELTLDGAVALIWRPGDPLTIDMSFLDSAAPTPLASGRVAAGLRWRRPGGERQAIIGLPGGIEVSADAIELLVGGESTPNGPDVLVDLSLAGGRAGVNTASADSFLASALPGGGLEMALDLRVQYSQRAGLRISGGAGLRVTLPLALPLGPGRLERLDVAVRVDAAELALEARLAGGLALGPFSASFEGLGAAGLLAFEEGNLGPLDLSARFLPPTGLGLAVSAGPVQGGGFISFDEPAGRYAGVLAIRIAAIGVTALGLIDTKLPGGQRGFALLIVLRAEFPPIQLGFGIALSAVGGLLALNRRIDVDALRQRFATGSAGRILAPEDPIRNAPVLLADLAAVFPPVEGVIVVGPTLQLTWVEIVRLDLGLFVELPALKIVLLGSARAAIPNPSGGRPVLQIRLDIIGLLDFQKKVLEFDAVLNDSHLLEILELTGGAAMRLSWGAEPYVVLTVGGFHPAYSPAPLVFPPSLRRVAMVRGTPTDFLYFRFEGYFALTTNTLQFGAAVELVINAGPLNARGFLGFDALIRFKPFSFEFSIEASVRIRWGSVTLAAVELRGTLTGPGPVTLRARITFQILWFEISWEDTFTLGSSGRPAITPVPSAVAALVPELERAANLATLGGDDPYVALAPQPSGVALPVVRPLGQLTWSQDRAPLELLLERFEGAPLARPETLRVTGANVTGTEPDWFAPGSFAVLSDADALNRRAFERLVAGVRIGLAGVADGPVRSHEVEVEQIRVPVGQVTAFLLVLPDWLLHAVDARLGIGAPEPVTPAIAVHDEPWTVVGIDGAATATDVTQAQAHQLARHAGGAAVAATDPIPAFAF